MLIEHLSELLSKEYGPSEMLKISDKIIEEIWENEEEKTKARLMKGDYKFFLQEFRPLSRFVYRVFPDDVTIKYVGKGNQGFDAEIVETKEQIEIMCPFDGKLEFECAKSLNEGDIFFRFGDLDEDVRKWFDFLTKIIIEKKSSRSKDYTNCHLIIAILVPYEFFELEHRIFIERMRKVRFTTKTTYIQFFYDKYKDFKNVDYLYRIN